MSALRSQGTRRAFVPLGQQLRDIASDEKRLAHLAKLLAAAFVVLFVVFAAFYVYDRYLVLKESPQEETLRQMEDAVRRKPTDATLRMQIATEYATQGRYEQAVAQYGEVLKLKDDSQPAILGMAAVELARHNDARAEELYRHVADLNRTNEFRYASKELQLTYVRLAQFASKAGRYDETVDWAKEALRGDSTNADALYLLGSGEEGRGNASQARDAYRKAVAFDPNFQEAFAGLNRVATALGDQHEASYAHGMDILASGDPSGAEAVFRQLVSDTPDYGEAYQGLGLALGKLGQRDEAAKAFHAALDRDSSLMLAQWSLRSVEKK